MVTPTSAWLKEHITWTGVALVLGGLLYVIPALMLLFAPHAFFDNYGYFPPFNRHYAGDAGAFTLPLGIGLLVAARRPAKYLSLIAVGVAVSWLHVFNHVYDDWLAQLVSPTTILLLALAAVLTIVYVRTAAIGEQYG